MARTTGIVHSGCFHQCFFARMVVPRYDCAAVASRMTEVNRIILASQIGVTRSDNVVSLIFQQTGEEGRRTIVIQVRPNRTTFSEDALRDPGL
jgi:hypothetical protein